MKKHQFFSAVLFALAFNASLSNALSSNTTLKRVCYYVAGSLTPDKIDPTVCTHIIFGFASVVNGTIQPTHPTDVPVYKNLMKLKNQAPELKIMISIGGGGGPGSLPDVSKTKEKRQLFIKQALQFLEKYGFDGLDIDWEFPGWGNDPPENIQHFSDLLTEFRAVIDSLGPKEKLPLLTAAVASPWTIIIRSYKVPEMAKSVDFINIMCYDYNFYQKMFPFTQHNSPLYKHHDDVIILDTFNINYTTYYWQKKGMPKDKMVIGIPTYGHTYTLLSADRNGLRAPATGEGSGGGWITMPQVCTMLKTGGTRVFDKESLVPYAYQDLNWASYDDVESFNFKAKWIVQNGYAGSMTWNLNCDDWENTCGLGAFPLHTVLRKVFTGK